ncbi:MAG: ribosome hibernation-promoting factor, HPF/YfiA family [Methyloligellaceae bacterium]
MSLQITGKNLDVGAPLREHISERVTHTVEKYIGTLLSGHVLLEKERSQFITDCSIVLNSGLKLQSHGIADDAYVSADLALDKLEKRIRRYKSRLKKHHATNPQKADNIQIVRDYVVKSGEDDSEEVDENNPIIIAEKEATIEELSVREAVMRLDVSNNSFLIFRNASDRKINIVYQRDDGNIGWIDPQAGNS